MSAKNSPPLPLYEYDKHQLLVSGFFVCFINNCTLFSKDKKDTDSIRKFIKLIEFNSIYQIKNTWNHENWILVSLTLRYVELKITKQTQLHIQ